MNKKKKKEQSYAINSKLTLQKLVLQQELLIKQIYKKFFQALEYNNVGSTSNLVINSNLVIKEIKDIFTEIMWRMSASNQPPTCKKM